ncbi:hypothetical protein CC86DRAFT_405234 [Ophiobolus disseminans]|uniref:Uncharacterized protein n=1 Tax=Ophiobolus disseminans TaxID=1469910 RepID=A0A6A7A6C7_9PLEO|nr:hypothetical protein CC86DRAFT_405234 [Ophiobolus disseminans]
MQATPENRDKRILPKEAQAAVSPSYDDPEPPSRHAEPPRGSPKSSALKPHATVTPLKSTSKISENARAVLEWTLFDGLGQVQAKDRYNEADYGKGNPITTHHGVGYYTRKYGPAWYEEQGAVRPWQLYTQKEQKVLLDQGLGKEGFPFVHPSHLPENQDDGEDSRLSGHQDVRSAGTLFGSRSTQELADIARGNAGANDTSSKGYMLVQESPSKSPEARSEDAPEWMPSPDYSLAGDNTPVHRPSSQASPSPSVPTSPTSVPEPLQPLPEELKEAVLAKHIEWLEANKVAYKMGDASQADAVEDGLTKLEEQATILNAKAFRNFKFGAGGYGTFTSRNDTLVGFGGLDILQVTLKEMRERYATDLEE